MHLYAICVDCLEGVHKIVCIKCKSRWDGSWHQLGTMYTYDILAASPCCQVGMWGWAHLTVAVSQFSVCSLQSGHLKGGYVITLRQRGVPIHRKSKDTSNAHFK